MTIVLKSNAVATRSVGNVHNWNGPSDFAGMLDFNRGEYYTVLGGERVDYSFDQAAIVTRSNPGEYMGKDGVFRVAPPNTGRIHHFSDLGVSGLLIEPGRTNLAATPTSPPPSQSITLPNTALTERVLISVYGTGDASIPSTGYSREAEMPTPFGKVIAYLKLASGIVTTTLDVTGSVQKVKVEVANSGPLMTNFYDGTTASDVVKLGSAFAALVAGGSCTVIARYVRQYGLRVTANIVAGGPSVQNSLALFGGIYSSTSGSSAPGSNVTNKFQSGADGVGTSPPNRFNILSPSNNRSYVMGVGCAGFGETVIGMAGGQSDRRSGLTDLTTNLDTIRLSGGSGIGSDAAGFANAIVTHAVIYDRALTPDEAQLAATQFL